MNAEWGCVLNYEWFCELLEEHGSSVLVEMSATAFWQGLHA